MLISSNMKRMKIEKKGRKMRIARNEKRKKNAQQQHTKYLFYMQR